jgi:hypothetical protein
VLNISIADPYSKDKNIDPKVIEEYKDLEKRLHAAMATLTPDADPSTKIKPILDGNEIMKILNVKPGPRMKEYGEFVKELKDIKRDFKIQEPRNISAAIAINNYEKYILNDVTALEVTKGCPIQVRAAAYHNYLLNRSKYKDKYPLIRSGEKINYYFVKTKSILDNNVFAYSQGTYPYEYAPPIDHDMQFTKTILDPINRFIEVMGYNTISPNLFLINALF